MFAVRQAHRTRRFRLRTQAHGGFKALTTRSGCDSHCTLDDARLPLSPARGAQLHAFAGRTCGDHAARNLRPTAGSEGLPVLDEAFSYVNAHDPLLTPYPFSHERGRVEKILHDARSAGVAVSNTLFQCAVSDLSLAVSGPAAWVCTTSTPASTR